MNMNELTPATLCRQTVHGIHHMDTFDLLCRLAAVLVGTAATLYLNMPVLAVLAALVTVATGALTLLELATSGMLCQTRAGRELVPVVSVRIGDVVHDGYGPMAEEMRVTDELIRNDDYVGIPVWDRGRPNVAWLPTTLNASITVRCPQNSQT